MNAHDLRNYLYTCAQEMSLREYKQCLHIRNSDDVHQYIQIARQKRNEEEVCMETNAADEHKKRKFLSHGHCYYP